MYELKHSRCCLLLRVTIIFAWDDAAVDIDWCIATIIFCWWPEKKAQQESANRSIGNWRPAWLHETNATACANSSSLTKICWGFVIARNLASFNQPFLRLRGKTLSRMLFSPSSWNGWWSTAEKTIPSRFGSRTQLWGEQRSPKDKPLHMRCRRNNLSWKHSSCPGG